MKCCSFRWLNLYGFFLVVLLLLGAFYLQYYQGIEPCPLCIIQRVFFAVIGLVFLIGFWLKSTPVTRKVLGSIVLILALLGMAFSARQIWLQHLPAGHVPTCGPGLTYIINNLPLTDAIKMIFKGTGDCATVTWTFLKLSLAEWSMLFYVLLGFIGFIQIERHD